MPPVSMAKSHFCSSKLKLASISNQPWRAYMVFRSPMVSWLEPDFLAPLLESSRSAASFSCWVALLA